MTDHLAQLRRAVKSGNASRVLDVVHRAWLECDDVDAVDWTPYRDALARFFPVGERLVLPAGALTVTDVARRFRRLFNAATPAQRDSGRAWYAEASSIADDIARVHGIARETAAYVLAALSPNVTWAGNVNAAHCACDGWTRGAQTSEWLGAGYHANKVKAEAILNGDLGALRGPKVTAFARGILGDPDACTIDMWMARAAGLASDSPSAREHRILADALRRVAREKGESVRDVQAIIWTVIRDRDGRNV